MKRSLLLVDAGYLFAQGGLVIHGTRSRTNLSIEAEGFLSNLTKQIVAHSGLPLLRTYWYDGAKRGIPTPDHLAIARLPYLKLRLGRVNSNNQQKGVDALIYRDLMTLSSERSIAQAYLLSGDDDLREGVLFAQDRGVRVVLLGISGKRGRSSLSRELQYEADEVLMLEDSLISEHLKCVPQSRSIPKARPISSDRNIDVGKMIEAADELAQLWWAAAIPQERTILVAGYPHIPKSVDTNLMKTCAKSLGSRLWEDQEIKKIIRHAFWQTIKKLSISEDDADGT